RRRAGDRLAARHRAGAGLAREVALEDVAVQVGLLRHRRVYREAAGGEGELAATDLRLGVRLEAVDPAVADAIAELLLLAPEDGIGEIAVEGLAEDGLLDRARARGHAVAAGQRRPR